MHTEENGICCYLQHCISKRLQSIQSPLKRTSYETMADAYYKKNEKVLCVRLYEKIYT